jgi:hypothetical protein
MPSTRDFISTGSAVSPPFSQSVEVIRDRSFDFAIAAAGYDVTLRR